MGWAARQRNIGSAALKLVLLYMAERVDDESGFAWPSVAWLSERTEQDERTVRKCLKALQEQGQLMDTGQKVGRQKNVTVWRLPKFDDYLAGKANPDKNAGVRGSAPSGSTQLAEVDSEISGPITGNPQPPQNCQGSGSTGDVPREPTPTNLSSNPDKNVPGTPAKMSGDSLPTHLKDSKSTAPPAPPSGGRRAKIEEPPPYDEIERRRWWRVFGANCVVAEAVLFEIRGAKRGDAFGDLDHQLRAVMLGHINRLVEWAMVQERPPVPIKSQRLIEEHIQAELALEMRAYRNPTLADRASAAA